MSRGIEPPQTRGQLKRSVSACGLPAADKDVTWNWPKEWTKGYNNEFGSCKGKKVYSMGHSVRLFQETQAWNKKLVQRELNNCWTQGCYMCQYCMNRCKSFCLFQTVIDRRKTEFDVTRLSVPRHNKKYIYCIKYSFIDNWLRQSWFMPTLNKW